METFFKDPNHGFKTYGGVSHADYNAEVLKEIKGLHGANGGKPIDKATMDKFLGNLQDGKGFSGKTNAKIDDFNDAIKDIAGKHAATTGEAVEKAGKRTAAQLDDIVARGRSRGSFWTNRWVGGVLAAGVTNFLSENVKAGQVILASPHLAEAITELEQGNIVAAEAHIFGTQSGAVNGAGGTNSLMEDLEKAGVTPAARLAAEGKLRELWANIPAERERVNKLLGK